MRKERFIGGYVYFGSFYVYGFVGVDIDLEFMEFELIIGIFKFLRGYSFIFVLEIMKIYFVEDVFIEEVVVVKFWF